MMNIFNPQPAVLKEIIFEQIENACQGATNDAMQNWKSNSSGKSNRQVKEMSSQHVFLTKNVFLASPRKFQKLCKKISKTPTLKELGGKLYKQMWSPNSIFISFITTAGGKKVSSTLL